MGTGRRFDGGRWVREQTEKRTRTELKRQDEEFIASHADAPDSVLLKYIRRRTLELGYVPHPFEVTGYKLIIERFGSWEKALHKIGYRYAVGPSKRIKTDRYKKEYLRQEEIFRQEREEKKRIKAERAGNRQNS